MKVFGIRYSVFKYWAKKSGFSLILATLYSILNSSAILAVSPTDIGAKACTASPDAAGCSGASLFGSGSIFSHLVSAIIFIVGAVSVVMVVIGGLRYTLSGGDSAGIKSAKETILYALIGLVVAILSYAIVRFVLIKVG